MVQVWALTGARAGDNAQVRNLAEALTADPRIVQLTYNWLRILPNWLVGETLGVLKPSAQAQLTPPWPDLVIAAGRRSVPAARWIKRQSGGKCKIVHLGRPRSAMHLFDLVVTTPQYGLPREANVVVVPQPFTPHPVVPEDMGDWLARWKVAVRQPVTGVLVGSSTYPYRLDSSSIRRLIDEANRVAMGAAVIYVTSPRTSVCEADRLQKMVGPAHKVWRWGAGKPNPYQALMIHADRFVVTEDSVSMVSDACATGKPVTVSALTRWPSISWSAQGGLMRLPARSGLISPPRNPRRLIARLVQSGQVSMPTLPAEKASSAASVSTWDDAVAKIRQLVENR